MGLFNFMKPKNEFELMLEEAKRLQRQNESDALYIFEHQNFRKLFFETGEQFIDSLINRNDFVYFVYSKQCELMKQIPKYTQDQFTLEAYGNNKNQIIFKLIPPAPYRSPLCHEIYMLVDVDSKPVSYYTLEKEVGNNPPVMCGWGQNGTHYNYGSKNIDDLNCGPLVKELDLNKVNSFVELIEQANSIKTKKSEVVIEKEISKNSVEEDNTNLAVENIEVKNTENKILFCRNCGNKLSEDEKFCHKCGTKV